jgi:hypothetical protein
MLRAACIVAPIRAALMHWRTATLGAMVAAAAWQAPALAQNAGATDATRLFEPIRTVLQSPRCQNCHIPGDAPLQYDAGTIHAQNVKRGIDGKGVPALQCSACHQARNAPADLGSHAPPGAPNWHLPPADMKMVFINLSPRELCMTIKDPKRNGKRSMDDFIHHIADDQLVAWGWNPGGNRASVPISKEDTVAAVKSWVAAGAPCPPS